MIDENDELQRLYQMIQVGVAAKQELVLIQEIAERIRKANIDDILHPEATPEVILLSRARCQVIDMIIEGLNNAVYHGESASLTNENNTSETKK